MDVPTIAEELLGRERVQELREAFAEVDSDGDGKLTFQDALDYVLDKEREKLAKRFRAYDANDDGFVSFNEFLMATVPGIRLIESFREFDADSDGSLTFDEIHRLVEGLVLPLSTEQVQSVIEKADQDGDGKLSYYEFYGAVSPYGFQ